ncbi:MAG: hydrogenase expression/formation protein HypE [Nitrospirae bacterium]|nr:hydrogenase expression/formation protein HypE [Nitrospirota bacterium]
MVDYEKIILAHGSGGKVMHSFLKDTLRAYLPIDRFYDSAILKIPSGDVAFTTDSFVVSPLFFPGGDIGSLAVYGTVNDLTMVGSEPRFISLSLIIEEGFPINDLNRILNSIREASKTAGVQVVTGDTKVVQKGKGDGIFINTAGIGVFSKEKMFTPDRIKPGDVIILSGSIGNHGMAVMAERNGLSFEPPVLSDTRPLNKLLEEVIEFSDSIHALRDPTRGGLATTLKEFALETNLCIEIDESNIPIKQQVRGACEILGLDPLYVANEGIFVAFVDEDMSKSVLERLRRHPYGKEASIIGKVKKSPGGMVLLNTEFGGTRMLDMLTGDQLPRIC